MFVIGDMAFVPGVPGMAQGAIQGGKYVAAIVKNEAAARAHGTKPGPRVPFKYFDKGSMATVSKWNAVAQIPLGEKNKFEFSGFFAWLAWLGLHLIYLVGFKTKIATLLSWAVTFLESPAWSADHHRTAGLRPDPDRGAPRDRGRSAGRREGGQLAAQSLSLPRRQTAATGQRQDGAGAVEFGFRITQFADAGPRRAQLVIGHRAGAEFHPVSQQRNAVHIGVQRRGPEPVILTGSADLHTFSHPRSGVLHHLQPRCWCGVALRPR